MSIRLLPSDLVDRIAAGEVVERPASVVKELLENAIDAGATAMQVEIEGGGLTRICVTDDGEGIAAEELPLALRAHATSKLQAADDLFAIRTLGFRGEALASIAAVSRLTITSRRAVDAVGRQLAHEGERVGRPAEVGCPTGTSVDVRELFFNTPARRAFLRSPATEQAHLLDAAARVILGTRRCGVVVTSGERRLLDLAEAAPEAERVRQALGGRIEAVFPFATERGPIRVSGYLTGPAHQRGDGRGVWTFVNGRYVRDRLLQRAVLDGFRPLVAPGRFPVLVLFVELDVAALDVNVHPQKLEVRFREPREIFKAISNALAYAQGSSAWLGSTGASMTFRGNPAAAPAAPWPASSPRPQRIDDERASGFFSSLRPLGCPNEEFVVCADGDDLILIHVAIASQRLASARLQQQCAAGQIERRALLFPEPLAATPVSTAFLESEPEALGRLGFELVQVGVGQWSVRAIPACLSPANLANLLADLLDENGRADLAAGTPAALARLIDRCAAHEAKPTDHLRHAPSLVAWLNELDAVDPAHRGPSALPLLHRLTRTEMGRFFTPG